MPFAGVTPAAASGLPALCALALLSHVSLPLAAQEGEEPASLLDRRHVFSAGGTRQKTDAFIRATVDGFEPVTLNLDDIGVDDTDYSYYLEYRYRFAERWSMLAGAYSFSGAGGRTASRDFNYDGVDFTAGAQLRTDFDIDAYLVDVMYRLYRSENLEVMVGGGIHALDLGVSISGNVSLNEFESEFRQSGTAVLAPVPNFRAAATWLAAERLAFTFVGGWLSANIDDYEGSFSYAHLRALYRFNSSLAVGLGYQVTDVDLRQVRANSDLDFDVRLTGPTLSVSFGF